MRSQIRCRLDEFLGLCPALHKVVHRCLRGSKSIRGLERLGRLHFLASIRHVDENSSVDLGYIAIWSCKRGHYLVHRHASNVVFCRRNVFHALRNGPAIRGRFEIRLRRCQPFRGIKYFVLRGFQQPKSLVFVLLRELLSAGSRMPASPLFWTAL